MRRLATRAADAFAGAAGRARLAGAAALAERWLAPLALGWALSFSQAPASFWPILFVAPPLAGALLLRAGSGAAAARIGWLLGVGYFLPGLSWIGAAFLVEADRFAWMRPFAVTLLPMALSLFWAAAFWAAWRASRRFGAEILLSLALAWSLAEYGRSVLLTGFPWGLFAFAWIDAPTAQAAAWIGPYGLNALTILAALGPLWLYRAWRGPAPRRALALGLAALAPIALLTPLGALRLPEGPVETEGRPVIRLVQPNIPQQEKWAPELVDRNLRILLNLSAGPADQGRPALVLWPETATPYPIAEDPALREAVMARMPAGARLIYGAVRVDRGTDGGREVFNSLVALSPAPQPRIEAVYDKHHLVPFGEYVPLGGLLKAIGLSELAGASFASGEKPARVALAGLPSFQPLICYEAIFPQERLGLAERPDWLLQSTNDAWFGRSAGPVQHLVQARFRAIEQGLPLFRSANTGISGGVDPYGRIMASLELGLRGAIDLPLPRPLSSTLYVFWGEAAHIVILSIVLASIVLLRSQSVARSPWRRTNGRSAPSQRGAAR